MKNRNVLTGKDMDFADIIEKEKKKVKEASEYWTQRIDDEKKYPGSHITPYEIDRGTYPSVAHLQLELATAWAQALEGLDETHPRLAEIRKYFDQGFYYG